MEPILNGSGTITTGDDGNPHIITLRRTGSTISQVFDGKQVISGTNSSAPTSEACLVLGEYMGTDCTTFHTSYDYTGDLGEMIVYDSYPSATDQQKVNTYLALKYVVPLDQLTTNIDYLDSAGNTIWSSDNTYEYDVVGIGQDDTSGLNRTSTKYSHVQSTLKISEPTAQADGEFLIWAHNNGTRLWSATGAPAGYQVLGRKWQAQETGDVGTVDIEIDVRDPQWMVPVLLSGSSFYLVYDSDNDGDLSDETPVIMKDDGTTGDDTTSDNKWTTQLNFDGTVGTADGRVEFTLATLTGSPAYPANISTDLKLWLRADSSSVAQSGNATSATSWTDLGPYGYVFDRTVSGIGGVRSRLVFQPYERQSGHQLLRQR